jgi:hypothetical protein
LVRRPNCFSWKRPTWLGGYAMYWELPVVLVEELA